jgi:hypothetical protein
MKLLSKYRFVILALVLAVSVALYYFISDNKQSIKRVKPAYVIEPSSLFSEFLLNIDACNDKYNEKVIQLSGKVVRITFGEQGAFICYLYAIGGVTCVFDKEFIDANYERLSKIKLGDQVTLKGVCKGFDNTWGVRLTSCYY